VAATGLQNGLLPRDDMPGVSGRLVILVLASFVVASTSRRYYEYEGERDKIWHLPGLPVEPNFQQFSGYLNGLDDNKLHYW
jgi:hypothetical protein